MSDALSTTNQPVQTVFTQSDLPARARNLLFRMKAELYDFDARPPMYKPKWIIEKAGVALLLTRYFDQLNAARYEQPKIDDPYGIYMTIDNTDTNIDTDEENRGAA
jgi:hypothetical protein